MTAPWYRQGTEPNKRIRYNSEGDPGEEMAEGALGRGGGVHQAGRKP